MSSLENSAVGKVVLGVLNAGADASTDTSEDFKKCGDRQRRKQLEDSRKDGEALVQAM